jgi:hypothetical protein
LHPLRKKNICAVRTGAEAILYRYPNPFCGDRSMSAITKFFSNAFVSGRNGQSDDHFNLLNIQERARFRKSMPGEMAMTAATRLYANGR